MLDRLLLELLDHVLELLPLSTTLQSAQERQEALFSCAVVSKKVSDRAVPLLQRDALLNTRSQKDGFARRLEDTSFAKRVRSLQVDYDDAEPAMANEQLVSLTSRLPELRCFSWKGLYTAEFNLVNLQENLPSASFPYLLYSSVHLLLLRRTRHPLPSVPPPLRPSLDFSPSFTRVALPP
jgi:hypothetical protein